MNYADKPWLSSYDEGVPEEVEIPEGANFADLVDHGLSHLPDAPAMFFLGVTLSFRELDTLSARLAAFLADQGFKKGDVVAINLPNCPQYLITLAGDIRSGFASTGVSILLKPKELAYQLNDSGARALVILDFMFEENFLPIADQVPGVEVVLVTNIADFLPRWKQIAGKLLKKIPSAKIRPVPGKKVLSFTGALKKSPARKPRAEVLPEDTALIQYTGGTTGLPKGVVLTHGNLAANYYQTRTWAAFKEGEDVFCSGFPFFHQAGQIFGLAAIVTCNPQCLIPDPRDTDLISRLIREHNATVVAMVPTLYQMLMDNPKFRALDFSNVRVMVSGAAPFSEESIRKIEGMAGEGKVLEVYGMTETSPLMTANPYLGSGKIGSVGLPLPSTMIRIMDTDDPEKEVPMGKEGEIVVSGPQVMARYHNKPEETDHAVKEMDGKRWLYTGDVARMDEDGYIFIVDRAKDMLNVGGYKVFSREVEETLYQHPAVEFCAIVGVKNPDRPGSEIVKAVVQLSSDYKGRDPEEVKAGIIAFCKENKASYKVPKIVEFTDAIPLTAVGKVDKKMLR